MGRLQGLNDRLQGRNVAPRETAPVRPATKAAPQTVEVNHNSDYAPVVKAMKALGGEIRKLEPKEQQDLAPLVSALTEGLQGVIGGINIPEYDLTPLVEAIGKMEPPSVEVNVASPEAGATTFVIQRDKSGRIETVTAKPGEIEPEVDEPEIS